MRVRAALVISVSLVSACSGSSKSTEKTTTTVPITEATVAGADVYDAVVQTCQQAVSQLGLQGVEVNFGLLTTDVPETFVSGDPTVLSEQHFGCELLAPDPTEPCTLPFIAVTASGHWAVVTQQVDAGGGAASTIAPPCS